MKYLGSILIILLLSSAQPDRHQTQHLIFPKFDSELINLWLSCQQADEESAHLYINKVYAVWDDVKSKLQQQQINHLDINSVIHDTDILIKEIDHYLNFQDYTAAELYAFHILWQFSDIRKNLLYDQYSLDKLITIYETYEEVHCIVNDEMMGLYEWGEFMQIVDQIKRDIKAYKSIVKDEMHGEYALTRSSDHMQKINTLRQKMRVFEKSLDTADRRNFIDPCEKVKPAITDLFKTYTQRVITS